MTVFLTLLASAWGAPLTLANHAPRLMPAYGWVDGRPVGRVGSKEVPTRVDVDPGVHEIWFATDEAGTETRCHGMVTVEEAGKDVPLAFNMMVGSHCPSLSGTFPSGPSAFKGLFLSIRSELELQLQLNGRSYDFDATGTLLNLPAEPHTGVVTSKNGRVLNQFLIDVDPGRRVDVLCTVRGCVGQTSRGKVVANSEVVMNDGTAEPLAVSQGGGPVGVATSDAPAPLLALAKLEEDGQWGYIVPSGAFRIPPRFERAEPFTEDGFASIRYGSATAFIDATGERLAHQAGAFKLMSVLGFGALGFREGLVPVEVRGRWGFLDTEGQLAIPNRYEWVSRFDQGLASARTAEGFVVLTKDGSETPVQAENIVELRRFREGLAPYRTKKKRFGFIDRNGKVVIDATYKAVGNFSEGLAWAREDKRVGFIDASGVWVIEPKYLVAKPHADGLARVKTEAGAWLFVRTDGTEKQPPRADGLKDFSHGLALVRSGDQWGLIDTSMEWAVQPRFERLRPFQNGFAAARSREKWGVIDADGKWVAEPRFHRLKDFEPTGVTAADAAE